MSRETVLFFHESPEGTKYCLTEKDGSLFLFASELFRGERWEISLCDLGLPRQAAIRFVRSAAETKTSPRILQELYEDYMV